LKMAFLFPLFFTKKRIKNEKKRLFAAKFIQSQRLKQIDFLHNMPKIKEKTGSIKMMIDAHAHLPVQTPQKAFSLLQKAALSGIGAVLLNASCGKDEKEFEFLASLAQASLQQISFSEKSPTRVFSAVGFHPFEAATILEKDFDFLESFLAAHPFLGIGEIGLDRTKPFFEKQLYVFERQLQIAKNLHRFVCVHNVKAFSDMQSFYKRRLFPEKVLFHRFEGKCQTADFLLEKGAFLSLQNPQKKWRSLSEKRIVLETDSSDFSESFLSLEKVYQQAFDKMELKEIKIEKNFKEFIDGTYGI
jgi:Tat protein secretion system quality control protein TatD with DNase activity